MCTVVTGAATVTVAPVSTTFTTYPVTGEPLLAAGAQETCASPLPAYAVTAVGASGVVAARITFDSVSSLDPRAFTTRTLKVYGLPAVRPLITVDDVLPGTEIC